MLLMYDIKVLWELLGRFHNLSARHHVKSNTSMILTVVKAEGKNNMDVTPLTCARTQTADETKYFY